MVCLPLAGLNHGAASDRWPTWGQASLPRSGFVHVPTSDVADQLMLGDFQSALT